MALTYGMSVKEFWEEDPDLFWAYRFSYYTKLKTEQEIFNNNAWLQGAYFHDAISVALCNAFSKSKIEYPKQPYGFEKDKKQEIKSKSAQVTAQIRGRMNEIKQLKENKQITIKGESRV